MEFSRLDMFLAPILPTAVYPFVLAKYGLGYWWVAAPCMPLIHIFIYYLAPVVPSPDRS